MINDPGKHEVKKHGRAVTFGRGEGVCVSRRFYSVIPGRPERVRAKRPCGHFGFTRYRSPPGMTAERAAA